MTLFNGYHTIFDMNEELIHSIVTDIINWCKTPGNNVCVGNIRWSESSYSLCRQYFEKCDADICVRFIGTKYPFAALSIMFVDYNINEFCFRPTNNAGKNCSVIVHTNMIQRHDYCDEPKEVINVGDVRELYAHLCKTKSKKVNEYYKNMPILLTSEYVLDKIKKANEIIIEI